MEAIDKVKPGSAAAPAAAVGTGPGQ